MLTQPALQALVFVQNFVARIRDEDRGATATEYALLVTLIAVVLIGAVGALGTFLTGRFNAVRWN
jgi:pilus assembly protein Flp/PilA